MGWRITGLNFTRRPMEPRTVKVFLDSGVLLSGLISDRGAPRLILDILSLGLPGLRGVTGRYNLAEIERHIDQRAPAARAVLTQLLPKLNLEVVFLPFLDELGPFRGTVDDKDLPVLASASIARADYFISEDERLLSRLCRKSSLSARPLRPAAFLDDLLVRVFTGESSEGGMTSNTEEAGIEGPAEGRMRLMPASKRHKDRDSTGSYGHEEA